MDFSNKSAQHKQYDINSSPKRVSTKIFIIAFRTLIVLLIATGVIGLFMVSGFIKGLLDTSPDISKLEKLSIVKWHGTTLISSFKFWIPTSP